MPDEKTYIVPITAGLVNSIFCSSTGDVQAIIDSGDLHQIIPMFRDWMMLALRHPDGTHLTKEEAEAVMDTMPADEYFRHVAEITNKIIDLTVSTLRDVVQESE